MKQLTRETLKIYWQHASRYKLVFLGVNIGMVAAIAVQLAIPLWYRDFFNILAGGDPGAAQQLVGVILAILGLHGIEWLMWRLAEYTTIYFQARVMSDLYNTCFEKLHRHSYAFFANNFVGSLVKKVTRYQRAYENLFDRFYWDVLKTAINTIGILIILSVLYWQLAAILVIWGILYIAVQLWYAKFKIPYELEKAAMDTAAGAHLADTVTNNVNLKLFGSLDREYKDHKKLTERLFRIRRYSWDLNAHMDAVQGAFMFALEFGVFYAAIRLWQAGTITIGDFALLQAYLINIFHHFWNIGKSILRIYEQLGDANEMTEILVAPAEVVDKAGAKKLKVTEGRIEFKDMDFGYHDEQTVFKRFNLTVIPGEKMALIGPSGGGKSTVVKLLLRFVDLGGGQILIDGQNIADVTQDSLRTNIALVPQDPILFHRSLMDNIRYGNPKASEAEVVAAAKAAHCHEFISQFPQGYDTFVGERGVKLSGGERQRVAIARALLKDAPILILDEATSSLDSESESYIQDALDKLMKDRTTIVIAHRLSTIMKMDRIVVLQDGQIVEEGKHEELLKAQQGLYQKLWNIQAGAFG